MLFDKYAKYKADDSVIIAVIWCMLALSGGTKLRRVIIPLKA